MHEHLENVRSEEQTHLSSLNYLELELPNLNIQYSLLSVKIVVTSSLAELMSVACSIAVATRNVRLVLSPN